VPETLSSYNKSIQEQQTYNKSPEPEPEPIKQPDHIRSSIRNSTNSEEGFEAY